MSGLSGHQEHALFRLEDAGFELVDILLGQLGPSGCLVFLFRYQSPDITNFFYNRALNLVNRPVDVEGIDDRAHFGTDFHFKVFDFLKIFFFSKFTAQGLLKILDLFEKVDERSVDMPKIQRYPFFQAVKKIQKSGGDMLEFRLIHAIFKIEINLSGLFCEFIGQRIEIIQNGGDDFSHRTA